MLFLGQIIAFAPANAATTANALEKPVSTAVAIDHQHNVAKDTTARRPSHASHHAATAHCLGCAIANNISIVWNRPTALSEIDTIHTVMTGNVLVAHFRPPIPLHS